jgi:hypothetical protein
MIDSKKSQIDKFREAAPELKCDEDEGAFDAALKRAAKAPPPKDHSKSKAKAPRR